MSTRLQGSTVVVTGGGSGIGKATAQAVAAEGGYAVVADVDKDGANAVAAEIHESGGKALALQLDVTSRDSWQSLVDTIAADDGGVVRGLVNNAGITRDRSLLKMSDDEWLTVMDVNLRGVWLGCQYLIPLFKEHGGGAIVNISSESRHGAFGQSNYAAAKAGVVGLTHTVAREHARHGVRCNAISPGTIATPMVMAVPEDIRESWLSSIPLGRLGEPTEVARSIVFLLSDDASYVTSHVLDVTGGSS